MRSRQLSQVQYSEVLSQSKLRGPMAVEASVIMHDPNIKQIVLFLMVMCVAQMASQAGTYMNVCTPLFEAKYSWTTESQKNLNEALMNTIPAVGTIFGSGTGSKLMGSGRARAFIIACSVGIFGSLLTFIEVWSIFLTAKFIVGSSIGMTGVIVARYIEEYVPLKWFGISQAISLTFL